MGAEAEEAEVVEVVAEGKDSVLVQTLIVEMEERVAVMDPTLDQCLNLMMVAMAVTVVMTTAEVEEDETTTTMEILTTLLLMEDADDVGEMTMEETLMLIAEMILQIMKAVIPHQLSRVTMNRQTVETEVAVVTKSSRATQSTLDTALKLRATSIRQAGLKLCTSMDKLINVRIDMTRCTSFGSNFKRTMESCASALVS